ncbi:DUF4097 family beta strand repeat-containing protein [Acidicapsa ligni]|uniref:DUF4097 family beta strand repeat-containing protein n=1 Tax=Acidicapsa ligni TaxID=542300 RepID=UPI0021E05ECB|nr:DUF4097 family beta strand repeat-containing protein [Acidicapsa ligni]
MASMPPPPPGTPPPPPGRPPYGPPFGGDPRDYWRYQKETNRAAWRVQRDAWRAQRDVLRAQSRASRTPSVAGPIILIGVGIVALLMITGRLESNVFWDWFARYWPVLLIGVGLIALAEWAIDLRSDQPRSRRFGGYIWFVVLLVIVGTSTSGIHHIWGPLQSQFDDNDDSDSFNPFRQPQHDIDQQVLSTQIPANAQVEIQNPHGDVSIAAGDDPKIVVSAHQVAYANSDSDAKKIFDQQQAHVTVTGGAVLVKVDGSAKGRTNLTITVPRTASINVKSERGGVTIAGLTGNVDAALDHGDMEATGITGRVHAHLSRQGDFSAHDIKGDITLEGNGSNLTISDVRGKVTLQGEYSGDIHLERVDQEVVFHSSRTDLELGRLPGDMSMSLDALHVTQVAGPVRVVTHSKDIEMSQVYGDTHIEDKDARVEVDMAGSYPVDVKNNKGDIEVSLPADAAVTVDGRTHNGDIVADFPLVISGDDNKTIAGNIGKGGPQLTLSTQNGDLHLRKGSDAPPLPPVVGVTGAPAAPRAPNAPRAPSQPGVPHLKTPKGQTEQPVSQ